MHTSFEQSRAVENLSLKMVSEEKIQQTVKLSSSLLPPGSSWKNF